MLGRGSTSGAFFPLPALGTRGSQSAFFRAPLTASSTGRMNLAQMHSSYQTFPSSSYALRRNQGVRVRKVIPFWSWKEMPATPCCWATSALQDESQLVDNRGSGAVWIKPNCRATKFGPSLGQAAMKVARDQEGAPDFLQIVLRFTVRNHGEVVRQEQRVRPSKAHPKLRPSPLDQAIEKFITGSRGVMLLGGPGKRIGQRLGVSNIGHSPQLWEISLQPELEGP
ncbi:unnamed protein product [Prunus armeniaca]